MSGEMFVNVEMTNVNNEEVVSRYGNNCYYLLTDFGWGEKMVRLATESMQRNKKLSWTNLFADVFIIIFMY